MRHYKTLPFEFKGKLHNKLIVLPTKKEEKILENGLIEPEKEADLCSSGKVIAAGDESLFIEGDDIMYSKLDKDDSHISQITIDGEVCDVIYENEVWNRNDIPVGRIFVEPLSDIEMSPDGIIIPKSVKAVTQKGKVIAAPPEYSVNPGDLVEYRKQEQGMFIEATINGHKVMVIYENDLFKINGVVAPNRIILKIDIVKQTMKRQTSESGLALSPLFQFMLYNLQFGEVTEIGSAAQELYPEINIGDTLIIHHAIEHQDHRLVGKKTGKFLSEKGNEVTLYEYRVLNCWERGKDQREIFGKLIYEKNKSKIRSIIPLNDSIFLKWHISLFEKKKKTFIIDANNSIALSTNLDQLRSSINHQKKEAAEKSKIKVQGVKTTLSNVDPSLNKDRYDFLETELKTIQAEETRYSAYISKNHLVVCEEAFPTPGAPKFLVAFYEELYPINIMGKKFLIAHPDFIIAKTNTNMEISTENLTPVGKYVIVRPEDPEISSTLLIPSTVTDKPQRGTVIAISDFPKVKPNDIVLFRKGAGIEQDIAGITHLLLHHNDLIAVSTK